MTIKNSKDNGDTFEREVVDFYQSQQLSSDRLHEIIDRNQSSWKKSYFGFGLAASILCLSLLGFFHQRELVTQQTQMVLREAALNHRSKLQMDAETDSIAELQIALSELPFKLKLPDAEIFKRLSLVGGRYCTISGNLAAHIKFADPDTAEQYSLFLTPYEDNLKMMSSPVVKITGVDVKLWREQDVVYAYAAANDMP